MPMSGIFSWKIGSVYTTIYGGFSSVKQRAFLEIYTLSLTKVALRSLLVAYPNNPSLVANLLSILERLKTFPTRFSELNSWWVEELGSQPSELEKRPLHEEDNVWSSGDEEDPGDDWRIAFENDKTNTKPTPESKPLTARLHKLTIHQSLHSLASHRAIFTRTWITLLSRLSDVDDSNRTSSVRALAVMHRGVIPHLTRPVLLMDWIGSCVDHGKLVFLLFYLEPRRKAMLLSNAILSRMLISLYFQAAQSAYLASMHCSF